MKQKFIYIFSLLGLCLLLGGCSLKEKVFSNSTRHTYYKNEMQVRSGLSGLYGPARNIYVNSGFWQMTECTTDLISLSVSTQYNANCDVSPSRPAISSTVWSNGYEGVMRCNEMIDILKTSDVFTPEQTLPWIAEAVVMRAFYYYVLTSTFGDVPFYTEAVTEDNRSRIASLKRMSAKDTRDYLIDELMEYLMPESEGGKAALPMVRTYESASKAYVGAAVGFMVAGKLCMWNERYQDAVKVYSQIEQIYGNYADNMAAFRNDYKLTDIRWSEKYVKESILEVGNTVEDFGLVIKGAIASWTMPLRTTLEGASSEEDSESSEESVSDIYNGVIIPELGAYARTYTAALPTSYYYANLLKYNDNDLRNGEYGNNQPWLGNKFWCFNMHNNNDGNNYKIFRYAGVLLNLAEAYLMLDDPDKACAYLNITRYRAAENVDTFKPITYASVGSSKETLMEEIRMECARELLGEFQRKFDLVRWGIWYDYVQQYSEKGTLTGNCRKCHRYYPIPDTECALSGYVITNDEYNAE